MTAPDGELAPENRSFLRFWRLGAGVVILAAAAGAALLLPTKEYLKDGMLWVEDVGPGGYAAVVGFYIVACLFLLPGSVVTVMAGFIFGVVKGTLVASVASTAGAAAAFLAGRSVARNWVASKVEGSRRFEAIDRAVENEGLKIVVLTRMSPVFPFNLLNYVFGVTQVRFRDYLLGSWLGMLPGTILFVYLGATGRAAAGAATGEWTQGPLEIAFFAAGLVVAVVVVVFATRLARRALKEAAQEIDDEHDNG